MARYDRTLSRYQGKYNTAMQLHDQFIGKVKSDRTQYLNSMKKKLIILIIRDQKFAWLNPSSSAFNELLYEKSSLVCDFVLTPVLLDGSKKLNRVIFETERKWEDLFCNIIRSN